MSKLLERCITDEKSLRAVLRLIGKKHYAIRDENVWEIVRRVAEGTHHIYTDRNAYVIDDTIIICGCDWCRKYWKYETMGRFK